MKTTKTAAYAAVAVRRLSGGELENRAAKIEKRSMDTDAIDKFLAGAVLATIPNTGPTIARPPKVANPNRRHAIRIASCLFCVASFSSLCDPLVLLVVGERCIKDGSKDPRISASENMALEGSGKASFNS
jgi:hypothetical protein